MPAKKTTPSARAAGESKTAKPGRRLASTRRPRWTSVYDDQRRAIEAARSAGIEDVILLVEGNEQVSRIRMNREMLAEMLAQVSLALPEDDRQDLRPSERLAAAMREAKGDLPIFRTKEELFDALEASD